MIKLSVKWVEGTYLTVIKAEGDRSTAHVVLGAERSGAGCHPAVTHSAVTSHPVHTSLRTQPVCVGGGFLQGESLVEA